MLRRVSSCVGGGQVCVHTYVTIRGTSALMASSMPAAATGGLLSCQTVHLRVWCGRAYGTKMAVAVAPVSLMPCSTLAKTGRPRCSWPAFLGLVPPTTFVPARPRQLLLSLRPGGCSIRMVAYRTRWPAVRGSCRRVSTPPVSAAAAAARSRRGALHSRSLLAGEALEQHLGVAVDAQVLDGLGVLRRARCVRPGRGLGERRAHGLSDGLHGVDCSCWMRRGRRRGIEIKRELLTQLAESRKLRQAHGPFCFCAKLSHAFPAGGSSIKIITRLQALHQHRSCTINMHSH